MTEQHSITPPPKLMQQWREQAPRFRDGGIARENWLMTRAAQYAEQKLEACINWVFIHHGQEQVELLMEHLRAASRPKPPSLKEQALEELDRIPTHDRDGRSVGANVSLLRLALEQLDG